MTWSSAISVLQGRDYIEAFDIGCMTTSVLWIFVTLVLYYTGQTKGTNRDTRIGNYPLYGLSFFALGGMILAFIEVLAVFSYSCSSTVTRSYEIFKIIFIQSQVIFVFFSRYKNIMTRNLVNGIFLFHTIVTNIILYTRTFLQSKVTIIHRHSYEYSDSLIPNCNCRNSFNQCSFDNTDFFNAYSKSSRFFYPFCLAFSLTASALLAELWIEPRSIRKEKDSTVEGSLNTRRFAHGVHFSSLLGLIFLGSFIFVIIYQQYVEKEEPQRVHFIFILFVTTVTILLCLFGLFSLRRNTVSDGGISLDEILVFFSLFCVYIINILDLTNAWVVLGMSDVSSNSRWQAKIIIGKSTLESVQSALQTVLITKALNRKPRKTMFNGTANIAIVLLFCNVGMWLLDCIYLDRTGNEHGGTHPYRNSSGEIFTVFVRPYIWVRIILYPMVVFFHIHCVFVLYRISNQHRQIRELYVPEHSH
jgi:hypothetical protein